MTNVDTAAPKSGVDLTTRDLSWFAQKVEQGRKAPYSEIITITPGIARRLLELNDDNRPLRKGLVQQIALDITHGKFKLNGETVVVSRDGYLNDGQHRLHAVIEADKPIQTVVMFGVDRESRFTVDMGAARSVGNFLHMKGREHSHALPTIARLLLSYNEGTTNSAHMGQRGAFTKQDILARCMRLGPEANDALRRIGSSEFGRTVNGIGFLSTAYLILYEHSPENCELFFGKLLTGAELETDSPILWLRNRLIEAARGSLYGLVRAQDRLEIVLRYYNAYVKDKSISRHITTTGKYPPLAA